MTTPTPEPKWFVFSSAPEGMYRAEFPTWNEAVDWSRKHGGTLTDSPTNEQREPKPFAAPSVKPWWLDRGAEPTAGNIAAADLCGSSCGEE
jgi:hypothetical protein